MDRGFGIEIEEEYSEAVAKSAFEPDWWSEADTVDFKLNDEPVTKSGVSRMNRKTYTGSFIRTIIIPTIFSIWRNLFWNI